MSDMLFCKLIANIYIALLTIQIAGGFLNWMNNIFYAMHMPKCNAIFCIKLFKQLIIKCLISNFFILFSNQFVSVVHVRIYISDKEKQTDKQTREIAYTRQNKKLS